MEQQLFWIASGSLVCLGIRKYGWNPKRVGKFLAIWLVLLMIVQFSMVIAARVNLLQSILPLHLCSATAFLAVPMLWRWDRRLFQFCWYLGMPGAFLALCTPVVGYSPWPKVMQAVFLATHSVL
ncbi:MAG TPA: YwaF family protein, partial [Clostridia bacterium]|nr:YwaF family protein [Clostridia bacterium]